MYLNVVFIESRVFSRQLLALGWETAAVMLAAIQSDLLANREHGPVVPGLGGVRKTRAADPSRGKGKRGGFRYLYLYFAIEQQIYLLYMFSKKEREDLSPDERKLLRGLAAESKP